MGKHSLHDSSEQKTKTRTLMPKILSFALFIVVGAVLFWGINDVVGYKGTDQDEGTLNAFYDIEENTIDVAYIGSSATSRFFINPMSYQQDGIASYSIGIADTPIFLYDEIIEEVKTKQTPQLYVIELRPLIKGSSYLTEERCRRVIDSLDLLSSNRMKMIENSLEELSLVKDPSEYDPEFIDYLFPVIKYHEQLNDEDQAWSEFLKKEYNTMQGFSFQEEKTLAQSPQKNPRYTKEVGKVGKRQSRHLDDLLEYCSKLDGEVLFVLSPRLSKTTEDSMKLNAFAAYVQERGWNCLNLNTQEMFEELGLDASTDFYNRNHVNYLGAEKYTEWFSAYLKEHYNLPDRRDDSTYSAWEKGYEDYKSYTAQGIKKTSKKEIADEG